MITIENLKIDPAAVREKIVEFISSYVASSGAEGVVIGLSGGIDSTTTAHLCVEALGPERVLGLIMPERGVAKESDVADAISVAEKLGIEYEVLEISKILSSFEVCRHFGISKNADINLKPRVRMCLLYYHANALNRLVAGTGNKSEILVGYMTKYGDGAADLLPIGSLYKTQVRMLAEHLGIDRKILSKAPSAGLWPGQTDEEELGLRYEELDLVLYAIYDLGLSPEEASRETEIELEKVLRVKELVRKNEHKRKLPPIPEI